ncbi:MAG: hypothetical protein HY038_12035 [Nitrospirae bacterium]|nr:hypothetical protein [Nitrospirota bacterium]
MTSAAALLSWSLILTLLTLESLSSCSFLTTGRLVYDQQDIRIGIEADPTVARSGQTALNNHPADLTPKELESLLQVIQVSGYSGTLVGLLANPQPVPLFTPKELSTISGYLATAFHQAKQTERVFFSLPKPDVAYSEDRTVGSLFLRGRYLHVVVTDHSSFIQADTGGGNLKDLRDSKGMKLWVAGPAQAAMVPDLEEPRWAPFETVHLSLNVKEVLAQWSKTPSVRMSPVGTVAPSSSPSPLLNKNSRVADSNEDLQLQVRELTSSNLELRNRLEEQNKRMQQVQDQLEQLRQELGKAKSKSQQPRRMPAP